ncbi:MAG: Crp/Fnr family transcriptional regulator [Bacteroidota bacterium]
MNLIDELHRQIDQAGLWEKNVILKRNDQLIMSGNIEKNLYYVVSGSLKVSIIDEDEEHIVRFGYQHNFITALNSFITSKPTEFYIQAIKKSKLKSISRHHYIQLLNQNDDLRKLWNAILQQLVVQQIEREKDLLTSSPKERYKRVLQRSPQLFQEIPDKHIASYLRMKPETLSRLKKS